MNFTMPLFISKKGIKEMGLEYDYPAREKACASQPLKVKLDGKHVGEIRKVKDGYQYYPKGEKKGGNVFPKVSEVQNSLLGIQSRTQKGKTPAEDDSTDEIMKQAKEGLKRLEKENKSLNESLDAASTFLTSISNLLNRQAESKEAVNLLEETVDHDGTEYDGQSLHIEINEYLESL